ncbi:phosphatidate cytidylyltransferase [Chelatococcus sambhunathii]|uniref:Phosphatidate cytidylyltransferase n=1 Tax=Chelatococcus sambhunathii TaxID=363953 RepID=A0ABU1DKZ1_9HYPH|nr:phosphatidate cytidylyltransferase [Chelatococcus sambhunathii]MDR4308668.1 phosphatidate cytidylyltransferase [Chelatococcus sambhunathii]
MSPLALVLGVVLLALVAGSVAGKILSRRTTTDEARATIENLNARTRSWWVMVVVFGAALLVGKGATTILFAGLSFMALREFWTLAPSRPGDHRALFASFFLVLPYHYWLLWTGWYGLFVILIPVYAFLALPALATLAGDVTDFLARSARTQWGLMLGVYMLSHAPALLMLETGSEPALLLLWLVVVCQLSDVAQYVFGKTLGRTRFSPNVSPSKTLEGLFGGGFSAALIGAALYGLTPFAPLEAFAMALAVVAAGFFGGFVLSAVKRDLGAKDWGYVIEGHGGVLDRVDSLIFAAPILFHLTRYWFTP